MGKCISCHIFWHGEFCEPRFFCHKYVLLGLALVEQVVLYECVSDWHLFFDDLILVIIQCTSFTEDGQQLEHYLKRLLTKGAKC